MFTPYIFLLPFAAFIRSIAGVPYQIAGGYHFGFPHYSSYETISPTAAVLPFLISPIVQHVIPTQLIASEVLPIPVMTMPYISSLYAYTPYPSLRRPYTRTEIRNIVHDYSKEIGHFFETTADTEATTSDELVLNPVPVEHVPTAPISATSVSAATFPTLLNDSVQQKLFAKKATLRHNVAEKTKL